MATTTSLEKKSLRICIVAARFPILGRVAEEGFLWPLAKSLVRRGHSVVILSWKNPQGRSAVLTDKMEAYFLGETKTAIRKEFPDYVWHKFLELHEKEPFDIVHSLDDAGIWIAKNKKRLGIAVTFDIAATQMAQVFAIMGMAKENLSSLLQTGMAVTYKFLTTYFSKDRNILSVADGVFVTTPMQAIALERYYLYPEMRTFRVPYGSEYIDLSSREVSSELQKKLNLPENGRNVVTVTDMTETEELISLLRAFQKLAIKKPNSRLIIVGNGPLYKNIEYEVLNLAMGSRVVFAGAVSNRELPDYINLADVYVNLSSRTSGFEPATLEAMALKKIVIGSELSSISTIIENGVDGYLIRPADESSLAKILIEIFAENNPEEQLMGERAHEKVTKLFDLEEMTDQLLSGFIRTLKMTKRKPKSQNGSSQHAAFGPRPDIQI